MLTEEFPKIRGSLYLLKETSALKLFFFCLLDLRRTSNEEQIKSSAKLVSSKLYKGMCSINVSSSFLLFLGSKNFK
jgi:hypothetical protein